MNQGVRCLFGFKVGRVSQEHGHSQACLHDQMGSIDLSKVMKMHRCIILLTLLLALLSCGNKAWAAYNDAPTISTSGSSTYSSIAATINSWKNAWTPPANNSSTTSAYAHRSAIIDQVEATILAAGKATITDSEYDVLADALCYWLNKVATEGRSTADGGVYGNNRAGWYISGIGIPENFFGYNGTTDYSNSQCVWKLVNANVQIAGTGNNGFGPMLGKDTRLVLFTELSSSRIYRNHASCNVMFSTNGENSKLLILGRKNNKISIDGGQGWSDPTSYTQVKGRTTTTARGQELVVNDGAVLTAYTTFYNNATSYEKAEYNYYTKPSTGTTAVTNTVKNVDGGAISMVGTLKACAFYNSSIKTIIWGWVVPIMLMILAAVFP